MKLLQLLGLEPDAEEIKLPPETQKLVTALTEASWEEFGDLRATAPQPCAVQQFLHGFLIYHLGKFPKGRSAIVH